MGDVLERLKKIVQNLPSMSNSIIAEIDGKYITIGEAIQILENKNSPEYDKLLNFLEKAGFDPEIHLSDEQWKLAYLRWLEMPDNTHIFIDGKDLSKKEILENIKNRTKLGLKLALIQLDFLDYLSQ